MGATAGKAQKKGLDVQCTDRKSVYKAGLCFRLVSCCPNPKSKHEEENRKKALWHRRSSLLSSLGCGCDVTPLGGCCREGEKEVLVGLMLRASKSLN